jgi:putative restriction endonuclease
VHWMFDRGLIGLTDDLQILISRQANDPTASVRLSTRAVTRLLLSGWSSVHIRAFCNGIGRIASSNSHNYT